MIPIRASPQARAELPRLAAGRALVIDYFASARCGVVVGDITAGFRPEPPAESYIKVCELGGVPVFAERRLVPLLEQSGPSIDIRRRLFGRRLAVNLDWPERWLDFLEQPGVVRRGRLHLP